MGCEWGRDGVRRGLDSVLQVGDGGLELAVGSTWATSMQSMAGMMQACGAALGLAWAGTYVVLKQGESDRIGVDQNGPAETGANPPCQARTAWAGSSSFCRL